MWCSVCGIETLCNTCWVLVACVELQDDMKYYALVVLYSFGQTEQKDLVFQLGGLSTQGSGGKHHSAGEYGKV